MISKIRSHWYTAPPVFLGLTLALSVGYVANRQANAQRVEAERWENHTIEVMAHIDQIAASTEVMSSRLSLYILTAKPLYFQQFSDARCQAPVLVSQLRERTMDSETQQKQVTTLEACLKARREQMEKTAAIFGAYGLPAAQKRIQTGEGEVVRQRMVKALNDLRATENRKLVMRRNKSARLAVSSDNLSYALLGMTGAMTLLFCAMAWKGGKELGETKRRRESEKDAA